MPYAAIYIGAGACVPRQDREGARILLGDDRSSDLTQHVASSIGFVTGVVEGCDDPDAAISHIGSTLTDTGHHAAKSMIEGVKLLREDRFDDICEHIDTISAADDAAWQIAGVIAAALDWQAAELGISTNDSIDHLCRAAALDS